MENKMTTEERKEALRLAGKLATSVEVLLHSQLLEFEDVITGVQVALSNYNKYIFSFNNSKQYITYDPTSKNPIKPS